MAWLTSSLSLRFMLHFATFGRWGDQTAPGGLLRYEVNLQPLLLAGGIGSIDVTAESIIPDACDLSYQVQQSGVWAAFAADPLTPALSPAPTQLPFRVVMTGTTDLMPACSMTNNQVVLISAPALAFHHYSTSMSVTSTSHVKVQVRLVGFISANHTLVGAIHGPSHVAFATSVDEPQTDGSLLRTWTFNVTTYTSFYIELHGTTDGTVDNFVVTSRDVMATLT